MLRLELPRILLCVTALFNLAYIVHSAVERIVLILFVALPLFDHILYLRLALVFLKDLLRLSFVWWNDVWGLLVGFLPPVHEVFVCVLCIDIF